MGRATSQVGGGEFPIADRRSGWAGDYTWRQNWGDFVEPEKLGSNWIRPDSTVEQFGSTSY